MSSLRTTDLCYLKVTIICRYIFLRFGLKTRFASTKFCDLYAEMVQGRQILMLYTTIVHRDNVCGYKILRFGGNPQKYQTLVPAKYSHLKVTKFVQGRRNGGGGLEPPPHFENRGG